MNLTIDFVVLTHDSPNVAGLLDMLTKGKDPQDKIIILDDYSTPENLAIYKQYPVKIVQHRLDKDYAAHRNSVTKSLNSTYSFFIDDDEAPAPELLQHIRKVIANNSYPDLIVVPRKNIFKGVLPIHALKYGWEMNGEVVNWVKGDYQTRIIKNKRGLKWEGVLHEKIAFKKEHRVIQLPKDERLALIHNKTLTEQVIDNDRYNKEWSVELNKIGGSYSE
jgi:Glycosyl transferase family 2